jgi:iron(III) transport system ATP-binding protein
MATQDAESDIQHLAEDHEPVLRMEGVSKRFGDDPAVDDVSLTLREGELLTLLGPSGCGKTTTLRLMAGLETPDRGHISLRGTTVAADETFVTAEDREVGLVFQDYALFPHLSVAENIGFGLEHRPAPERERRVDELLSIIGLEDRRERSPEQLSGGEKQRVALARSLAPEPDVVLLDEPFSNLDVGLRVQMREEVSRILDRAGVSAVSVTHDQEEALSISDRIGVMRDGSLVQVGEPERVFQQPESRFVADFLGNASFVSGTVDGDGVATPIGEVPLDLVEGLTEEYAGNDVDVLARPDDMAVMPASGEPDGEIVYRQYDGPNFVYRVELRNGDVVHCMHNHVEDFSVGTPVDVELSLDHPLAWYPHDE